LLVVEKRIRRRRRRRKGLRGSRNREEST